MSAGSAKAPLIEVFHSVQGEGRFVGMPMAFLRVATCPIRCAYCDTPQSYVAAAEFVVRSGEARRTEANPVAASSAAELVMEVAVAAGPGVAPCLSITGGEPLVAPQFVAELGGALRARSWRVHLETAALDPVALGQCIDVVDHLSADYKLPETLLPRAPQRGDFGRAHRECCALAIERGVTVDVKCVLTAGVTDASLARALDELAQFRARILLVLQPVTPFGAERDPLPAEALRRHAAAARARGFDFRVLPQVHRQLGLP